MTRICDYEGSRYRQEFWEQGQRAYEDLAERIALRRLLPTRGHRLIEVGAGFGRLVDLYAGYDEIVLTDYARTQLVEAQKYLGDDPRIRYVVADVYNMPFAAHCFDAMVMVRVMHHLEKPSAALGELARIMAPGGRAVLEYANKRNIKAIARWLLRRQDWNPFNQQPFEFVELNYDFHPRWMHQRVRQSGFAIADIRTVSHFRIATLKRLFPANLLASLDGLAQKTGPYWQLAPSVFLACRPEKPPAAAAPGFFRCPNCGGLDFDETPSDLSCNTCHTRWPIEDGIYDFKTPRPD